MRRSVFVVLFALLVATTAIGCGSGGQTVTETVSRATGAESDLVPVVALSPAGVEKCLGRGATVLSSEDLNPGSPINAHGVFAVSDNSGARIGIVLTLKPYITKRLSRQLAEEGAYDVNVTPSEEAVVVLDAKATPDDEALASECSEPR
jgi:hypothetical protein